MRLFDLHCDTLYRAFTEHSTLFNDEYHISFKKASPIAPYIQCLAVWIPDEYRGDATFQLFEGCVGKLREQLQNTDIVWCRSTADIQLTAQEKKQGIILTVEGGAVLGGKLEKIQQLYDIGVRMMTLTWNGRNELGDGIGESDDNGLTEFGKSAVREMENVGMIVDISHAGEKLFRDVAEIARKPFIASHSNARTVTPHKRNLLDEQIETIISRKGIIGLNYCVDFLNKNKTNANMCDIIEHAGYFIGHGAEQYLAMGADFDGADIPSDMGGIESVPVLYEMFADKFGRKISDDIFFGNALRFFTDNLGSPDDINQE